MRIPSAHSGESVDLTGGGEMGLNRDSAPLYGPGPGFALARPRRGAILSSNDGQVLMARDGNNKWIAN